MNKKEIIISILIRLIAIGVSFTTGCSIAKEDSKQEIKETNNNKTKLRISYHMNYYKI